ncbi:hypothetical protein [Pseudoprimorskyibacter insulae]|uniref:hypothetical protein n=1 Tax=Pseudoprimorskyibacter insulae TaxID=1695997 RepID=UPI000D54C1CF|nr:hypothetical protein [Pseudoprimorskyibacter insulae]
MVIRLFPFLSSGKRTHFLPGSVIGSLSIAQQTGSGEMLEAQFKDYTSSEQALICRDLVLDRMTRIGPVTYLCRRKCSFGHFPFECDRAFPAQY